MKVLIIANTLYQMVVAVQLTRTVLKKAETDLWLSDHSAHVDEFVGSAQKTGLFHEVRYIESLSYDTQWDDKTRSHILPELQYSIGRFHDVRKICGEIGYYDKILAANLDDLTVAVYDFVKKLKNPLIRFYLFEDGLSSYKTLEMVWKNQTLRRENSRYSWICKNLGLGKLLDEIRGIFVFHPELFDWKRKIKLHKIPIIKKEDEKMRVILNQFFGYKNQEKQFEGKKVIFFEESFVPDGEHANDKYLLDMIAQRVGKENVLVKLHPRSRENRFEGYEIYEQSNVPWEVVFMNHDFRNITLVSISSGSTMHPYVLFGDTMPVVVLQKMANMTLPAWLKVYEKFLREKVFEKNPQVFIMPENKEELLSIFS